MRLELTGRHVDITPALRRLVDRKLLKLDRMLNDSALSAQVVLSSEKSRTRADVTLHARGEKFLHGVGRGTNWQAALGAAVEKIAQQAETVKGKWETRKRRGDRGVPLAADEAPAVALPRERTRPAAGRLRMPVLRAAARQRIRAMSIADAAREVGGRADAVLVFRDLETSAIAVLYRLPGGELTLVETES
jgi:ribosome hibernation promoting factor